MNHIGDGKYRGLNKCLSYELGCGQFVRNTLGL